MSNTKPPSIEEWLSQTTVKEDIGSLLDSWHKILEDLDKPKRNTIIKQGKLPRKLKKMYKKQGKLLSTNTFTNVHPVGYTTIDLSEKVVLNFEFKDL